MKKTAGHQKNMYMPAAISLPELRQLFWLWAPEKELHKVLLKICSRTDRSASSIIPDKNIFRQTRCAFYGIIYNEYYFPIFLAWLLNIILTKEAFMDGFTSEKLLQNGISEERINEKNLSEIDLSHRILSGIDLRGFTITKVNLEHADLTAADLRFLQFGTANCVGASFIGADLRGANLSFGYFNNSDFRGADLRGAILVDSLCSESNFSGADLRGATLGTGHYDSDFRGADLRGAVLPPDYDFEQINCDMRGALLTVPKDEMAKNMRKLERIQLSDQLPVINKETQQHMGSLIDINAHGLKIMSQFETNLGSVYKINIILPGECIYGETLELNIKSIWCNPDHDSSNFFTGFEIQNPTKTVTDIIDKLIKNYRSRRIEITD
ncbi:MAG: hypothetical protein GF401_09690 [Chitinivibrionales bacterium]|nr:hypothetical protein [Chitinivibrionales bacterium]